MKNSESAKISVYDRGLHYGDGLFETLLCHRGQIPLLSWHQKRLSDGLRRLAMQVDEADLWSQCQDHAHALGQGSLKLLVTRGEGPRGYLPSPQSQAGFYILSYPSDSGSAPNLQQIWDVQFCTTPVSMNAALAGMKTLNRLDSVLARMEWQDSRIDEGLLADSAGYLVEGTRSNLFCVQGEQLLTPRLDQAGVAGVTRQWIIDHFEVSEVRLDKTTLLTANEVFMTNSLCGVAAVRRIDDREYDAPGLMTLEIREKLQGFIG